MIKVTQTCEGKLRTMKVTEYQILKQLHRKYAILLGFLKTVMIISTQ